MQALDPWRARLSLCSRICLNQTKGQLRYRVRVPTIVVDIHSHILPEVDDGPKSWDVAVAMCRMAAADGITHQVATPHANDRYHYDRTYLQGLVSQLQKLVGDSPKLSLGCDFHLSYDNLQDALKNPSRYAIEGTHYMLVELSNYSVPFQTTDSFLKLGDSGMTCVITHPERNPILRESPQRVVEWAEQGCVIQMTGSALTGFWGERVRRVAHWLLEHNAVHVLSTDAHDTEKRIPVLSTARDAAAEIVGNEVALALVESNPRAIINSQPLPYFPRPLTGSYRKGSN
jgi:protein-tyrosine phosphatase